MILHCSGKLTHVTKTYTPGRTASKERVTFLACTNADSTHKLKTMVIGKARNPRAFRNCASLPVESAQQKMLG